MYSRNASIVWRLHNLTKCHQRGSKYLIVVGGARKRSTFYLRLASSLARVETNEKWESLPAAHSAEDIHFCECVTEGRRDGDRPSGNGPPAAAQLETLASSCHHHW
jgi:hypothetical protein